jgi:hypothetical protein
MTLLKEELLTDSNKRVKSYKVETQRNKGKGVRDESTFFSETCLCEVQDHKEKGCYQDNM